MINPVGHVTERALSLPWQYTDQIIKEKGQSKRITTWVKKMVTGPALLRIMNYVLIKFYTCGSYPLIVTHKMKSVSPSPSLTHTYSNFKVQWKYAKGN